MGTLRLHSKPYTVASGKSEALLRESRCANLVPRESSRGG